MCGVIAAFGRRPLDEEALRRGLALMRSRGPDSGGEWQEEHTYLGHRRLAILDPSPRGKQPMSSADGRFVISFNGEIYNFKALREDLEIRGVLFRTTTDTEVILALFERMGEAMLPLLHGMFAMVIWDRVAKRAFVARDPYGIKPLYVATTADGVLVASQVRAILATGLVSREPDARGQAGYWMLGSVPEPHTWFRDIRAVRAGHSLWVENAQVSSSRCWRDIGEAWREARPGAPLPDDAVFGQVGHAIRECVARHIVADTPVGLFLSGGIDSGTLAGLMVESGLRDLQCITVRYGEFEGTVDDEAPVASQVARHYGVRHHARLVTRDEFLSDLPRIIESMDQPTIDGVNTWYASKLCAELGLKVAVSGVGGDELFFGYASFVQLPRLVRIWAEMSRWGAIMGVFRAAAGVQARRSRNRRWLHAPEWARSLPGAWWLRRSVCAPDELPSLMGSDAARAICSDFEPTSWLQEMVGPVADDHKLALAQIESMTYLRNQLLRDSDWASMAHSVELRTPLVDSHLLESVKNLLTRFGDFPKKRLLASVPARPLPAAVLARHKTGFGIPMATWLAEDGQQLPFGPDRLGWSRQVAQEYSRSTAAS